MSFFDDVDSTLKSTMLEQVPIEVFYDKYLLKDNIDTIEFENTEFQEYLAAKEITRLGNNIQTVFELSVDPELREIYPSWFNTLSFVVDIDISLLKPLLNFGQQREEGTTQGEEYHRFLTKVDVERLPLTERKGIFEQVFTYYQSVLHWIEFDIAEGLSYYFDISQHDLIKYYADCRRSKDNKTRRSVYLGNVARVVGFLLQRDLFNTETRVYWRRKLISAAKSEKSSVVQRNALFALEKLKDDSVIRQLEDIWQNRDELVRDRFIELCKNVNPNHDLSIKYFVEGSKGRSTYARYGLDAITDPKAIKRFLDSFIRDKAFLAEFMNRETIYKDKDIHLMKHIEAVWDTEIDSKLRAVVREAFVSRYSHYAEDSRFIRNVALLLKKKNKGYIFRLIQQISQSDDLKREMFGFIGLFADILEKEQVKHFVEELSKIENGDRIAFWTLQRIKGSSGSKTDEIYEEGRKYLPREYRQAEERGKLEARQPSQEERIYSKFQFKLQPKEGEYYPDVFRFYFNNKDQLQNQLTQSERKRLKWLVENSIFDKYDPGGTNLELQDTGEGGRTYTVDSRIHIFGDCLKVAKELNLDVSKYRRQIVNYIPFAYSEHLEAIFALVQDIRHDEAASLLSVYKQRDSDLWRFMPDSFIRACEKFMIREAVPILREFVVQTAFSVFDRERALETSENLSPDSVFLREVFEYYITFGHLKTNLT